MKAHHTYHLGTGTLITDATGEAFRFFMNLPFGETMIEQGGYDYDNPYKFNDYGSKKIKYLFTKRIQRSCELDAETGLYYYGARYGACPERSRGNPKISMWSSVDPLAEKYPSFNPYNYVLNNPVKLVDPTGKSVEIVPIKITGTTKEEKSKNKQIFLKQVNEVTGGNYIIKNGFLKAKNGNYGTGINADLFKEAIDSENTIPINLVNNDTSTFIDSFLNTNLDIGDIELGSKEVKGLFYAHVMKERLAAGSNYASYSRRLAALKPSTFGNYKFQPMFNYYHTLGLEAEVEALSFHTGIARSEFHMRTTENILGERYLFNSSYGMKLDYGAYKFSINTTLQGLFQGRFNIKSMKKL